MNKNRSACPGAAVFLWLGGLFRRPLPGGVDQCQKPYGCAINLVEQTIAFVHHQLTRARYSPGFAKLGGAPPAWPLHR